MKFTIKHEKKGRIRVHLFQKYMNFTQADTLQYYLENLNGVKKAQVFNRTSDALIYYTGERNELLKAIQAFGYSRVSVPAQVLENSGRELNETYKEKLVNKVIFHYGRKLLLPYPLSAIYTTAMSVKYIWLGVKTLWKRKIEVPVLDATAIGVSIFRGDFSTAGSVMFLLGIGELLEEWTHMRRHLTLMHLSGQLTSQCIQKFCSIHSIIQPFLYKTTNHYPVSNRLCAFSILTILALIRNYPSHKIFMKSEAEIAFFHSDRFSPHSKHLLFFTNIHRLF